MPNSEDASPHQADPAADTTSQNNGRRRWRRRARAVVVGLVVAGVFVAAGYRVWRLQYERTAAEWLDSAEAATTEGDYATAAVTLDRIVTLRPRSAAAEVARERLPQIERLDREARGLSQEAERLAREERFEEAAEAYARIMNESKDSALAALAYQRRQAMHLEAAARNAFAPGGKLEEQGRYLEACLVYGQVASKYPNTIYGARARERETACAAAAPALDAFERHRSRGELDLALKDLDGLLELDVPRGRIYMKKAKVHEQRCEWREAAKAWREADRLQPSDDAKRRAALCDERAAQPVLVRNVKASLQADTGETILSGEVLNNTREPRRDIEVEVRFYGEKGTADGAGPLVIISHIVKHTIPPGGRRAFSVNVGVVPEAKKLEARVVGVGGP